jgi:hypothetical protein
MRSVTVIGWGFGVAGVVLALAGPAHAQGGWTDAGAVVHLTTGADRVGIGTRTPAAKLHVSGSALVEGTVHSNRLSAIDATGLRLRIGSDDALRLEPTASSPNIIGGSRVNEVDAGVVGATIGGGGDPEVVEPRPNIVTDSYGTVGGGRGNQAGDAAGSTNDASGATVGGGRGNTASGEAATWAVAR